MCSTCHPHAHYFWPMIIPNTIQVNVLLLFILHKIAPLESTKWWLVQSTLVSIDQGNVKWMIFSRYHKQAFFYTQRNSMLQNMPITLTNGKKKHVHKHLYNKVFSSVMMNLQTIVKKNCAFKIYLTLIFYILMLKKWIISKNISLQKLFSISKICISPAMEFQKSK